MEVLYLKSQGMKHQDLCRLCQISKTTLTKYIKQYQAGGAEALKSLDYHGQPSALNQYSDVLRAYFANQPASSVAEASAAIEKLTGIKRSPTQVRALMQRLGLRCLKVGYVPGKSVEPGKIEAVQQYRVEALEPLLQEATTGEKAVFFVACRTLCPSLLLGVLMVFDKNL